MNHVRRAPTLFGIVAGLMWAGAAASAPVFTPASTPGGLLRSLDVGVEQERFVRLADDVNTIIESETLDLNLFDDLGIQANRLPTLPGTQGRIWHGEVPGYEDGLVVMSADEDVLIANITLGPDDVYQLRYYGDGTHVIRRVEPGSYPPEAPPTEVEFTQAELDAASSARMSDDGSTIDVLVAYTAAALAAEGGLSGIKSLIHLAMYETNLSYFNSNIDQRLNLVHMVEVAYTESGNVETDRNRLKATSDGHMDTIHTLRNRYCADVVSLFVENGGSYCGIAYIMSTVTTAFESSAFCVVDTECATGYYSFGHELGHIMSARHDWWVDPSNNSPFTYNHAYVNVGDGWRTIMGYNTECASSSTYCTRLPYWSNPNVVYGGDPMGTADGTSTSCTAFSPGTCNAENWKTLNTTDVTVANFRDSCVGTEDVWMKDTWTDTGAEPDPLTASQSMWRSPYIWVRLDPDSDPLHQHEHQNPELGQDNYVYVELHNGSPSAMSGTLNLYWAAASSGLSWPTDWTLFDAITTSIPGDGTKIEEGVWSSLPGTGHYCLLARWVSTADPMNVETTSVSDNTRNNNNIVWRNVNIVNDFDAGMDTARFIVRNIHRELDEVSLDIVTAEENGFLRHGELLLRLDERLFASWVDNGAQGFGVERVGDTTLQILDPRAQIFGIPMQGDETGFVDLVFLSEFSDPAGSGKFEVDVIQFQREVEVGGVGYELDVFDSPQTRVKGAIFDRTGVDPVAAAVVSLYERTDTGLEFRQVTQSNALGAYGFFALPGTYRICVEHPDYGPECYGGSSSVDDAADIPVESQTVAQLDIELDVTVSVSDEGPARAPLSVMSANPLATELRYVVSLSNEGPVRVRVFDVAGRVVSTLVDRRVGAGTHEFSWDLKTEDGTALASGVYLLQLTAGSITETRRVSVVR